MTDNAISTLRITRRFGASAECIFDAWLNPEAARKWLFTTPTSEAHNTEIDPRVGGKWTIIDRREGTDYKAIGEYIEIERPTRLVFSFGMPQFSSEFSRVTIQTAPETDGCTLMLTQEPVPSTSLDALEDGWNKMFDMLSAIVD